MNSLLAIAKMQRQIEASLVALSNRSDLLPEERSIIAVAIRAQSNAAAATETAAAKWQRGKSI